MGSCFSGAEAVSRKIDKDMEKSDYKEKMKQKLMLLGSGSSGKSTIFKQLNWLYCEDHQMPSSVEPISQVKNIRESIIESLTTLIMKAGSFYVVDEEKYAGCNADAEELSDEMFKDINTIFELRDAYAEKSQEEISELDLGPKIVAIWKLKFIQEAYKYRSQFHIADNIEYFFINAETIFEINYIPSREDILKARIRTTGLVHTTLEIEDNTPGRKSEKNVFEIWDAGGQKNERSKWIHQFEGVTGLIYVAALNHFNQVLFEDEKKNAMHDSIFLFRKTVNNKYFINTEVILFLNKKDLFMDDLKLGEKLDTCFISCENCEWNDPDHQWNSDYNYAPELFLPPGYYANCLQHQKLEDGILSDDLKQDLQPLPDVSEDNRQKDYDHFLECFDEATKFISNVYCAQHDKNIAPNHYQNGDTKAIFTHITCATDKDNIKNVFWDVQNMVIRANLKKYGLMAV